MNLQSGIFEQAQYHKVLLLCGRDDEYDAWLDALLECDEEHAEFLVELAFCGSDVGGIVSCINRYCPVNETNEYEVFTLLRAFWLRKYLENTIKDRVLAESMYTCWVVFRDLTGGDPDVGYGMSLLHNYYLLAEEGVLTKECYEQALVHYLETGTIYDVFGVRNNSCKKDAKEPFSKRFLRILHKNKSKSR